MKDLRQLLRGVASDDGPKDKAWLVVVVAEVMEAEADLLLLLLLALLLLLLVPDSWWRPTFRRGRNQHGLWRARRPAAQPRSPSNQPTYI